MSGRRGPLSRLSPASSEEGAGDAEGEGAHGDRSGLPHLLQMPSADDGVGRQAVDLRLVEEEEEGAEAADPVARVLAVQAGAVPSVPLELLQPLAGALAQLVER